MSAQVALKDPFIDANGVSHRVVAYTCSGAVQVVTRPSPEALAKMAAECAPDPADAIEDAEAVEVVQSAHPSHRQEAVDFFHQHLDRWCTAESCAKWLKENPGKNGGDFAHWVLLPGGPLARAGLIDVSACIDRAAAASMANGGKEAHARNSARNALCSTAITENSIVIRQLKEIAKLMQGAVHAPGFAPTPASTQGQGLATAAANAVPSAFNKQESKEWYMPPRPLPGAKPVPLFKEDWLPGPLRKRACDLAAHLSTPIGFVGTSFYGWLGGAIGGRCAIRPRPQNTSWLVVPNIWTCLVGRPSDKKSPVVDATGKHLNRIQDTADTAWRDDKGGYDNATADHDKVIKKMVDALARAKANGEDAAALEKRIAEEREKAPTPPKQPFYVVGGFSPESLAKNALQDNPGGVVIHVDELVHALRAADPVLKPNERALLLKLFAGTSSHRYMSIAQGTINIPRAVASLVGTTQIKSLASYREELEAKGNDGMLARILFDASGPVPFAEPTDPMDRVAAGLVQRIFDMLASLVPQAAGASIDVNEDGEHGLPFVTFTAEAQPAFDKWYAENEKAKRETDDDDLAELMGKHDKRCAALALVHAMTEWVGELAAAGVSFEQLTASPVMPWGDKLPRFRGVGVESVKAAIEMIAYYNSHAEALLSASQPGARALRKLAERVVNGDVKSGMTVGQVAHLGWAGITHKNAQDLFEELENLGWLTLKQARVAGRHGGRPTFSISVHPDVPGNVALLPGELPTAAT